MVNLNQMPKYKYEYQSVIPGHVLIDHIVHFFKYIKPFLQGIAYVTAQDTKQLSQGCYPLAEVG